MSRFNTGNPLSSLAEEDFYDNCLSLDQAMNSTEPTWRDRFNVEKPTIDAALKSAGFMPAGFDFVTGGTLQPGDRNKAVYNPAPNGDNNWYRWNGVFPKEIAANSQPNPKDENNWVPVLIKTGSVAREALRRTYQEVGLNLVSGSFEEGANITSTTDVVLHEKTGKCYSGPIGNVPKGTDPLSEDFSEADFISSDVPKINVRNYGFSEFGSSYENSIALQKAAAAANATGGCAIEFPEGTYNVGYQDFAGQMGLGYSYRGGQYFRLKNLSKPILLKFNNTKIIFGEGQRVGSFDPNTGNPLSTIQTDFNYRAFRGILFGFENCNSLHVTGQLEIDFKGETVKLGGEFGDAGFQCPEYGFWFIGHKFLSFDLHYTAYNGAMDGIYLAGLNGEDCASYVSNVKIDRMGRTNIAICGGSNITISGVLSNAGLGSVVSHPGCNISIEPEVRSVNNVTLYPDLTNAKGASFNIWNTGIGNVKDVKLIGGVLSNTFGYVCKSNTSNVKYLGLTFRGVIGEHSNEFFDSDKDPVRAEMLDCSHFDTNHNGAITPFINGTHFDRNKIIRLKLSNYNVFSAGLTASRFTLGRLLEPSINVFKATIIGDITPLATTGARVLSFENPIELLDLEIIDRTNGSGLPDLRAYIEIIGINDCRVRNVRISGIGQPTANILWISAYFSAGGRSGYLVERDPLNKQPAFSFLPLAIDGHRNLTQSISGYGRLFLVSDQPTNGNWDWLVGDTLIRAAPASGQQWGWKCTVAGKAGAGAVFKPMGTLG